MTLSELSRSAMVRGDEPRQCAAPVVADDVEPLRAEAVRDRQRIGHQQLGAVCCRCPQAAPPPNSRAGLERTPGTRPPASAGSSARQVCRVCGNPCNSSHQLTLSRPRRIRSKPKPIRLDLIGLDFALLFSIVHQHFLHGCRSLADPRAPAHLTVGAAPSLGSSRSGPSLRLAVRGAASLTPRPR